jgi:hypothetical protein
VNPASIDIRNQPGEASTSLARGVSPSPYFV